ncbi:MAG TPA: hypothetical protein VLR26_04680 [Frankiaceae bacterium]|nr:hypothetical protein [Frankiaceae bacterium]
MAIGAETGPLWSRWLRGEHADHARFLDMHANFAEVHLFGIAVGGTCLLTAYWYGLALVWLVAVACATMGIAVALGRRRGNFQS